MSDDSWFVVCSQCGVEFDLRRAAWCEKHFQKTKLCPNKHCICHLITRANVYKFRPATPEEQKFGFNFMLKKEYGGRKDK